MRPYRHLILFGLLATILQAGQYGSLSPITFAGTYTLPDQVTTVTRPNGNMVDTVTWKKFRVSSADVLREMKELDHLAYPGRLADYRLALVASAHHGDGIALFAVGPGDDIKRVPEDVMTYETEDGPMRGTIMINPDEHLLRMKRSTANLATLTRPGLAARGAMRLDWNSVMRGETRILSIYGPREWEAVELASGTGRFIGPVTVDGKTGVAEISLVVGKPKVVKLADYGMATSEPSLYPTGSVTGGDVVTEMGDMQANVPPSKLSGTGRLVRLGGSATEEFPLSIWQYATDGSLLLVAENIDLSPYVGGTVTLTGNGQDDLPDYTILDVERRLSLIATVQ